MIEFPCHCGNPFSVPQDMAGDVIQCPQCGRLNDVPLLSDLQNLDEAGNYKLDEAPSNQSDPDCVETLTKVFTRNHYDENGQPIDLRGPVSQVLPVKPLSAERADNAIRVEPLHSDTAIPAIPLLPEIPGMPAIAAAPKYDPDTGELVRELEIKPEARPAPKAVVPVAKLAPPPQTTPLDGIDVPTALEFLTIPIRLMRPVNFMVMLFILLAHVLGQFTLLAIFFGYFLLAPFWLVWHAMFLSHLGNVIDETGPQSRNELPTPLRHLGWHEDTWGPFLQIAVALVVCFGPSLMLLMSYGTGKLPVVVILALAGVMAVIGLVLFPAALLAATTSGTLLNLRPDRLVGVAVICGAEYILALFSGFVGIVLWLAGFGGLCALALAYARPEETVPPYLTWYVSYGVLAVGIYLTHFFCWHLGMLYRKHQERFPWVMQRHAGSVRDQSKGFPVGRVRRTATTSGTTSPPSRQRTVGNPHP